MVHKHACQETQLHAV